MYVLQIRLYVNLPVKPVEFVLCFIQSINEKRLTSLSHCGKVSTVKFFCFFFFFILHMKTWNWIRNRNQLNCYLLNMILFGVNVSCRTNLIIMNQPGHSIASIHLLFLFKINKLGSFLLTRCFETHTNFTFATEKFQKKCLFHC